MLDELLLRLVLLHIQVDLLLSLLAGFRREDYGVWFLIEGIDDFVALVFEFDDVDLLDVKADGHFVAAGVFEAYVADKIFVYFVARAHVGDDVGEFLEVNVGSVAVSEFVEVFLVEA
jgi:hypothetical protein